MLLLLHVTPAVYYYIVFIANALLDSSALSLAWRQNLIGSHKYTFFLNAFFDIFPIYNNKC